MRWGRLALVGLTLVVAGCPGAKEAHEDVEVTPPCNVYLLVDKDGRVYLNREFIGVDLDMETIKARVAAACPDANQGQPDKQGGPLRQPQGG